MISQFSSCAADPAGPVQRIFAPPSDSSSASTDHGDDFLNAFSQALNPAGARPASARGLPADNGTVSPRRDWDRARSAPTNTENDRNTIQRGAGSPRETVGQAPPANGGGDSPDTDHPVLNPAFAKPPLLKDVNPPVSVQPDPSEASSGLPLADAGELQAETNGQNGGLVAKQVRPKAAKSSSEHSDGVSPGKAGAESPCDLDAAAATNVAAQPAQPLLTPAAPSVPAGASIGNIPISILTVGADGSEKAGSKSNAPHPVAQTSVKATPMPGALEPARNDPRSPAPPTVDRPVDATPALQTALDASGKITAASSTEDQSPDRAENAGLQPVELQGETNQAVAPPANLDVHGIGAALDDQRMKFAGQTNEIAGRTVQKLPRTPGSRDGQTASDAMAAEKPGSKGLVMKEEVTVLPPTMHLKTEAIQSNLPGTDSALVERGTDAEQPATRVEQVAHLVAQEAAMVRQSGSTSLAVSLKVDPHTELFVQLTNHDGQIQASLRCERGSLAGLDGHWGQLQESLARQNVQLLPLQDRNFSRTPSASANADGSGSRDFGKSSQNQQPPAREERGGYLPAESFGGLTRARKSGGRNSSRRGWESWA